jgi:hypothetical protein
MGVAAGKGKSVLIKIDESRMLVEEQSYVESEEKAHRRVVADADD